MFSDSPRSNPTTIPHTKRQRVTTRSGAVLERAYVFMPEASWTSLQALSAAQHRSGSQIIENLISIAISGNPVKDKNESSISRQF